MEDDTRASRRLDKFHHVVFVRLYMSIFECVKSFGKHVSEMVFDGCVQFFDALPAGLVIVGFIYVGNDKKFPGVMPDTWCQSAGTTSPQRAYVTPL